MGVKIPQEVPATWPKAWREATCETCGYACSTGFEGAHRCRKSTWARGYIQDKMIAGFIEPSDPACPDYQQKEQ